MDHNGVPEHPTLSRLNPQRDVSQLSNASRGLRKGYASPSLASGFPAFGYANGSIRSTSSRDNGPLDDMLVPQANSTSAAVGSPTFYTGGVNRGATKRFNSILADYSDFRTAQREDHDNKHGSQSTEARPKSPVQGYNAPSRFLSVSQKGWWLQPAFSVRRKRSISAESTVYERSTRLSSSSFIRQLSRRQALGILCLTFLTLYLVLRRPSPQAGSREVISQLSSPTQDRIALFERKWWEPPVRSSARKRSPKRTSFATPQHTLEELLQLPSRYSFTGDSLDASDTRRPTTPKSALPTVAAVLDCSSVSFDDPIAREDFAQQANSLLRTLSQQTFRPQSVTVLFPPSETSKTAEHLLGYDDGWVTAHTVADTSQALSFLTNAKADYLLFLDCPRLESVSTGRSDTRLVQHLLHAAGTAEYANKILSTSGVRLSATTSGKVHVSYVPARGSSDLESGHLEESQRVHIPITPVLLERAWLADIFPQSIATNTEGELPESLAFTGLGSGIAISLHRLMRVESYALPITSNYIQGRDYKHLAHLNSQSDDFHRLSDYAGWSPPGLSTADTDIEQLGNPAKVAIILPSSTTKVDESLENLICRFSSEQTYGHEVRVFLPSGSAITGMSIKACPEVEIEVESDMLEDLAAWKPEICLSITDEAIPSTLRCTKIVMDVADMAHADWLSSLSLESLQNWHTTRIELVVITNNRPHSLHRLLTSLSSAIYFNDTVNLNINLEQTADGNTSQLVSDASWPYGTLSLRRRIILGELMPSIVESWYPSNNDSYGVLLEDDVEVSPHFYAWIKFAILQYRYGPPSTRVSSRSLAGISLYQPKNIELRVEGRRKFDAHRIFADIGISATTPYLSQIPCSWGAVYFPEHWKEFHQYLILRLGEVAMDLSEPIIPDIRSNRWHKSWKRYMIELMYLRGYSMLYPNYEDFRSLSTNHLELGTHVKDIVAAQKRKASFEVPLLALEDTLLEGLLDEHLPSWDALPLLDFWGGLVTHGEALQRASITLDELALCPISTAEPAVVDDQETLPEMVYRYDAGELLCPRAVPTVKNIQDTLATAGRAMTAEEREIMLAEREAAVLERETRLAELEELGFDF